MKTCTEREVRANCARRPCGRHGWGTPPGSDLWPWGVPFVFDLRLSALRVTFGGMPTLDAQVRAHLGRAFRLSGTTDPEFTSPHATSPVLSRKQYDWLVQVVVNLVTDAEDGKLQAARMTPIPVRVGEEILVGRKGALVAVAVMDVPQAPPLIALGDS